MNIFSSASAFTLRLHLETVDPRGTNFPFPKNRSNELPPLHRLSSHRLVSVVRSHTFPASISTAMGQFASLYREIEVSVPQKTRESRLTIIRMTMTRSTRGVLSLAVQVINPVCRPCTWQHSRVLYARVYDRSILLRLKKRLLV